MPKTQLKAIDLFAGAGGLSLGLELAGIEVVGSVEYCPKAVTTYKHNFPGHVSMCKDITEFPPIEMEKALKEQKGLSKKDIDIIAGGPPCPGFSNIGRSKIVSLLRDGTWSWGDKKADETRHQFIQDPRNELFLEFVKYVEHFEPRWFIMENVPGMLTSKNKNEQVIPILVKQAFFSAGYECRWKVLSADDFGVPQARKRLIFIGWRTTHPKDEFKHPVANKGKKWTALDAIDDLPLMGQDGGPYEKYRGKMGDKPNKYQKQMRHGIYKNAKRKDPVTRKIPTGDDPLTCHFGRAVNPRDRAIFPELTAHEGEKRRTYDEIEPSELEFPDDWCWDAENELVWNGKSGEEKKTYKWYNRKSFKDKMRRISGHKPSPTLVAHMAVDTYMYIHPTDDRTITPREAARIQSFPDNFDFSVVSFTSQYRQIGNAVPPLMGKAIAEEITKIA
ncbi:MAG: DNA cytosine methyltransferase [Opitutae bacterium]|jgi:DNA (cytosine-5)-methyltransferase 1|nr:DNA cytosine methyltransferase [Opitutae bacterium]